MNWHYPLFLDWSIEHGAALEQWLRFWSVDCGKPSALPAGQQEPAVQLWIANAPWPCKPWPVWFCSPATMSLFCRGVGRLPFGNQGPAEGATYFFILKYCISLLSAGTSDSLAKSLAIRTRGRLGSQAACRFNCSLFFQWVLPGSLVCSTYKCSSFQLWREQAQVGKLPRVTVLFQLVFMEIEVLHQQFFHLSSAWLGGHPTSRVDFISKITRSSSVKSHGCHTGILSRNSLAFCKY